MFRLGLIIQGLATALALVPCVGISQNYPTRAIRIITVGTGGGNDLVARLIAQGISGPLGEQVVVDNRAAGITTGLAVHNALPDGYTLLVYSGTFWTGALLQKDVPYDIEKDFAPISLMGRSPYVLAVHPSVPVNSVKELIALAKAKPGELNYSSGSTGSSSHMAGELFKTMAGVNIVRISYKSDAQEFADLMGGHVQMSFRSAGSIIPQLGSNRFKPLAVGSAEPSALFPGLPTVAAAGLPGFLAEGTFGIWAPAKTPEAIIRRLNTEIVRYLNTPRAKELFMKSGTEVAGSSPEEFAAYIKADIARVSKLIKDADISVQ